MTTRKVELPNYSENEGDCSCGECEKKLSDLLLVCLQAFNRILCRVLGYERVRHIVTGGARCKKRQHEVYYDLGLIAEDDEAPDSYHQGENRVDEGTDSVAVDGRFEGYRNGEWERIPEKRVARVAKNSNLFGGIGWKAYDGFIHLDLGPGREW